MQPKESVGSGPPCQMGIISQSQVGVSSITEMMHEQNRTQRSTQTSANLQAWTLGKAAFPLSSKQTQPGSHKENLPSHPQYRT